MLAKFYGFDDIGMQSMATGVISDSGQTMVLVDPGCYMGKLVTNEQYEFLRRPMMHTYNRFTSSLLQDMHFHNKESQGRSLLQFLTHKHHDHRTWHDVSELLDKRGHLKSGVVDDYGRIRLNRPRKSIEISGLANHNVLGYTASGTLDDFELNDELVLNSKITGHGALGNGEDDTSLRTSKVGMLSVSDGRSSVLHTGDAGGPYHVNAANWIIEQNPDVLVIDMPFEKKLQMLCGTYAQMRDPTPEDLEFIIDRRYPGHEYVRDFYRSIQNSMRIIRETDTRYFVFSHHGNRGRHNNALSWMSQLQDEALRRASDEFRGPSPVDVIRPVDLHEPELDEDGRIVKKTSDERFRLMGSGELLSPPVLPI